MVIREGRKSIWNSAKHVKFRHTSSRRGVVGEVRLCLGSVGGVLSWPGFGGRGEGGGALPEGEVAAPPVCLEVHFQSICCNCRQSEHLGAL